MLYPTELRAQPKKTKVWLRSEILAKTFPNTVCTPLIIDFLRLFFCYSQTSMQHAAENVEQGEKEDREAATPVEERGARALQHRTGGLRYVFSGGPDLAHTLLLVAENS